MIVTYYLFIYREMPTPSSPAHERETVRYPMLFVPISSAAKFCRHTLACEYA